MQMNDPVTKHMKEHHKGEWRSVGKGLMIKHHEYPGSKQAHFDSIRNMRNN